MNIAIGLVGIGKIARDQHAPVLGRSPRFDLVATASRHASLEGVAAFPDIDAMLDGAPRLEAVALCQPPQVRFAAACRAIEAGRHVFLEKPPGVTVEEVERLAALARSRGVTLFASWHSRYASGVDPARAWLAGRSIRSVRIDWKEDVRVWHPGQAWIWEAGGMGVFDPGINALSIATHILPPFTLEAATLEYPANRDAPIAATLDFATDAGRPIHACFDWRQTGPQSWDIRVETEDGVLLLADGGNRLLLDGKEQALPPEAEYAGLYARFADLIESGTSDVDVRPLAHVLHAFAAGRRERVAAFDE